MNFKDKYGQSFSEYVLLIVIISAALIAMTAYIMRAVNARLEKEHRELDYYRAER